MNYELVTVGNFQYLPEAEAARMHLESAGIQAFLSGAEIVNADWFLGNAVGYIKIQVGEPQAKAAYALLQEMRAHREAPETPDDALVCLACGAPLSTAESSCAACGWSYAGPEGESRQDDEPDEPEIESLQSDESPGGMSYLLRFKRPLFLIMLTPFFVAIGVCVLSLLMWLRSLVWG
jgi:hypothetical protein